MRSNNGRSFADGWLLAVRQLPDRHGLGDAAGRTLIFQGRETG
jgi:hypothetical protein